jgi:hypothetical protein
VPTTPAEPLAGHKIAISSPETQPHCASGELIAIFRGGEGKIAIRNAEVPQEGSVAREIAIL